MSTIGKRVIWVGPADGANQKPLKEEGIAVSAIAPGTILKQTAAGLAVNDKAATVFGEEFLIADKDQLRSLSVDTAWTIDENMAAIRLRSGEFANVLAATGQSISAGATLTRNGAGLLAIAATDGSEQHVCTADETVTTTATQLVRVKV